MSAYSVETVSSFQYPVIKQSKISDWQGRRRDLLSIANLRWKYLVMFGKGIFKNDSIRECKRNFGDEQRGQCASLIQVQKRCWQAFTQAMVTDSLHAPC
jgi:hypothetical protein